MKKEKIYDFAIDNPLTDDRRKIIEAHIKKAAQSSGMPLRFGWAQEDARDLRIAVGPVEIEVRFHAEKAELFAAAPIWARMLFTDAKKVELKTMIEKVIVASGLRGPVETA
ncbi:hypothetical protein [Pseudochelatococcus contaminans]|uniref:Uncharacterized protein n=1 Tax=Pseudochelatococcus contaminans TaxID=1538103 RepID=A0A7W6EGN9_9HYPH|nr:hypothetical protein [Pseudochelatococcus contaminans]MBB3809599.1 hypothetical protein [Pseudochelatococcus contaminans]